MASQHKKQIIKNIDNGTHRRLQWYTPNLTIIISIICFKYICATYSKCSKLTSSSYIPTGMFGTKYIYKVKPKRKCYFNNYVVINDLEHSQ